MTKFLALASAAALVASVATASACTYHDKMAETSKPTTTALDQVTPVKTPKQGS